jgi:hypothetical protein
MHPLETLENILLCTMDVDTDVDPLLLNLLEMWCCLVFQTLTRNALHKYLPPAKLAPYAGMHLNVALPLHQSTRGEKVNDIFHGDLYHSQDPHVQKYYQSLRHRFWDLKYSPNLVQREYYANRIRQSHQKRNATLRGRAAQELCAESCVLCQ